ncbi:LysE family translocator [Rhizobium helianthi]|uniref:LysE family translocator n=1 Tax=Rhizobium helianthi TaxID=1132695 RepID=A0ABW4M2B6_9HYPH
MDIVQSYWPGIFLSCATYAIAAMSPGPAMMATMGAAMESGRKAGFVLGLGIVASSMFWGLLSVFGLSTLLLTYPGAVWFIQIFGCIYLLYLAYKTLRSVVSSSELKVSSSDLSSKDALSFFLHGCALNITNPKAIMTWIAIISLGLAPDAPIWVVFAVIGGTMIFAFVFYSSIAFLFSTQKMVNLYAKAGRWIDGFMGLFFIYAAFALLRH